MAYDPVRLLLTVLIRLAEDAIAGDESRPRREEQLAASMRPGTVLYEVSASSREEGEWIADRIVELNRVRDVPFEQIAILRRSLLDARPLVDALASRGIPLDVAAATTPEGSSARHLALLLSAAGEEGEDPGPIPASQALTSPLIGLSPSLAWALRTTTEATERSPFGLIRSGDAPAGVSKEETERARRVVAAVDDAASKEGFLEKLEALWKGLPYPDRGLPPSGHHSSDYRWQPADHGLSQRSREPDRKLNPTIRPTKRNCTFNAEVLAIQRFTKSLMVSVLLHR